MTHLFSENPVHRRRTARRLGRLLTALGDVLFEPGCLRCGHDGQSRVAGVCAHCWSDLAARPQPAGGCPACGESACATCPHDPPPWTWLATALVYDGTARDLILLYKFGPAGGRVRLASPLAAVLAAAVGAGGLQRGVDVVTAVPSHRQRVGERGFDAARVLASRTARRLGLPAPRTLLRRRGHAAPRARGPLAPARAALQAPFRLRRQAGRQLAGRTVLLIDDVLTTGATIRTCAGLLTGAGAGEVRVAVLARTPRARRRDSR